MKVKEITENIEFFILVILSLLLIVIPGLTFVFYFNYELFISLNIVKLVLLSLAFITPLIFINFIFITGTIEDNKSSKDDTFISFVLSSVFSGLVLYVSLLVSYIRNMNFRNALFLSIIAEIFLIILILYRSRSKK